jgi:HK97 family phage major capsid protein
MAKSTIAVAIFALLIFSAFSAFGGFADAAPLAHQSHDLAGTVLGMGLMLPGLPHARQRGILDMRASGDAASAIAAVNAAFEKFKSKYDGKLDELQAAVDQANTAAAARGVGAGQAAVVDPEYNRTFANWTRNGSDEQELRRINGEGLRANIQASMSVGTDSAGGYLAPIEWDRQVIDALRAISPMRRLATVIQTTVRAYTTVWSNRGWGSGWVGETAARPETAAASLSSVPFGHGEIYAMPAVTQQLLDDADFPLEEWLSAELAGEFVYQEGPAFVAGNGTNKPNGFLTYATGGTNAATHPGGAIAVSTVAAVAAVTSDELIDVVYALPAPYRQNASWVMNSTSAGKVMKLKDGDGNYVWQRNLTAGQPSTLMGYPVEIEENMPDMAAGALPIAFGDFKRGYVINDRTGVRILRDPYTNKPYVNFYATKRVGGGVRDPKAIRVVKMAAS